MSDKTYDGQPLDPQVSNLLQACLDDLTSNFRCADCFSDSRKLEIRYKATMAATMQERQIELGDLILRHYDPNKQSYQPSEEISPLCHICAIKRKKIASQALADYFVYFGGDNFTI